MTIHFLQHPGLSFFSAACVYAATCPILNVLLRAQASSPASHSQSSGFAWRLNRYGGVSKSALIPHMSPRSGHPPMKLRLMNQTSAVPVAAWVRRKASGELRPSESHQVKDWKWGNAAGPKVRFSTSSRESSRRPEDAFGPTFFSSTCCFGDPLVKQLRGFV